MTLPRFFYAFFLGVGEGNGRERGVRVDLRLHDLARRNMEMIQQLFNEAVTHAVHGRIENRGARLGRSSAGMLLR